MWEGGVFLKISCYSTAAHIFEVSLQRVIKAAASAYGRTGLRGEGCERMPNQLKPKKLDLPHLHPCSHRLQITLQGRVGKGRRTAARGMQSQPSSRQGCVSVWGGERRTLQGSCSRCQQCKLIPARFISLSQAQ